MSKIKSRVIIIEDDVVLSESLTKRINETENFQVDACFTSAINFLSSSFFPDIIILDIILGEENGINSIQSILLKCPNVAIVINSIKDDPETIFNAIKRGAVGYLDKQSSDLQLEEILLAVRNNGAYMTPKIARKVCDHFSQAKSKYESLTMPEQKVAKNILDGHSYKMIADDMGVSIDTVRMHIKRIYRKLSINSKSQLFNLFRVD